MTLGVEEQEEEFFKFQQERNGISEREHVMAKDTEIQTA